MDTCKSAPRRPARLGDLATLFELDRACFGRRSWSLGAWREVVTLPDWTTVVVEFDGAIAAVSVLLLAAPESWLASLAVAPAWRRRGLARFLVRDALERARVASARWLSLEVDRGNSGAISLYTQERFGVLRRFREDGHWRQEMLRRLGGARATPVRAGRRGGKRLRPGV